ncbi:hypothetical protein [Haloimpatiens lingqiaonensis]|uniref:hypothetical protein n=1 Tax=Haloimpatiens lingqiaonensis TaxID=1380675 RepID=UPI0010FD6226|nr:hypothetical protein [Haloimpatiens lingqiaonensis]
MNISNDIVGKGITDSLNEVVISFLFKGLKNLLLAIASENIEILNIKYQILNIKYQISNIN